MKIQQLAYRESRLRPVTDCGDHNSPLARIATLCLRPSMESAPVFSTHRAHAFFKARRCGHESSLSAPIRVAVAPTRDRESYGAVARRLRIVPCAYRPVSLCHDGPASSCRQPLAPPRLWRSASRQGRFASEVFAVIGRCMHDRHLHSLAVSHHTNGVLVGYRSSAGCGSAEGRRRQRRPSIRTPFSRKLALLQIMRLQGRSSMKCCGRRV